MRKRLLLIAVALFLAVPEFLLADGDGVGLRRLSAEFQNNTTLGGDGEISTTAAAQPAGAGGMVFYDKTVKLSDDVDVIYVTFSGQGDAHNGSALLMNATVNGNLIQPLAGQTGVGGGSAFEPHLQTGWYTLLHLPDAGTGTNCNDGFGGPGDCHDSTLYFSGCYRLAASEKKKKHDDDDDTPKSARIMIALADLPGGTTGGVENRAFIERTIIYIDGQKDRHGSACKGVGTDPH
jgi:hypothetical protein